MGRRLIVVGEPSIGKTIETIFKENNVPVTVVVQESPEKKMIGELIERSKKEAEAISKLIQTIPLSNKEYSNRAKRRKEKRNENRNKNKNKNR